MTDLSKLEAGRMEMEKVHCAPASIIGEVVSILRPRAEGNGLRDDRRPGRQRERDEGDGEDPHGADPRRSPG